MVHGVRTHPKCPRGFTLIEMMAVLVLFGLLTAVVLLCANPILALFSSDAGTLAAGRVP